MKTQNLTDLNGYLFEQLERLNQEDMAPEALRREMNRAEAMSDIAKAIVSNAKLVLRTEEVFDKRKMVDVDYERPALLE